MMSELKKYVITAKQPTIYKAQFYAKSKNQALKLAYDSHGDEWEEVCIDDWENYEILEEKDDE